MDELKKTEFVNRGPSFGSSLLDDDLPTVKALDPLQLEAPGKQGNVRGAASVLASENKPEKVPSASQESTLDPLLQNPGGATQMFNDMHGIPVGLEGAPDITTGNNGMRHMAGLTVGAQRVGTTDWGSGTDGGTTGKPQDGVPYGSFTGV